MLQTTDQAAHIIDIKQLSSTASASATAIDANTLTSSDEDFTENIQSTPEQVSSANLTCEDSFLSSLLPENWILVNLDIHADPDLSQSLHLLDLPLSLHEAGNLTLLEDDFKIPNEIKATHISSCATVSKIKWCIKKHVYFTEPQYVNFSITTTYKNQTSTGTQTSQKKEHYKIAYDTFIN